MFAFSLLSRRQQRQERHSDQADNLFNYNHVLEAKAIQKLAG